MTHLLLALKKETIMSWKTLVDAGGSVNNKFWLNEGPPGNKNQIAPLRGFHVNIPSISGGVGTVLNYDSTISNKLTDNNLTADLLYSGNYYTFSVAGDGVGIELNYPCYVESIELYINGSTGATLVSNTLHVMVSVDGINWEVIKSVNTSALVFINDTNYGYFTIDLPPMTSTKFIAVRSTADFYLNNSGNYLVRAREFKIFTPEEIGINEDVYQDRLTGRLYEKRNGVWVLTYTPPEIPRHLVGTSMVPPSGSGIPLGSIYIVKTIE